MKIGKFKVGENKSGKDKGGRWAEQLSSYKLIFCKRILCLPRCLSKINEALAETFEVGSLLSGNAFAPRPLDKDNAFNNKRTLLEDWKQPETLVPLVRL